MLKATNEEIFFFSFYKKMQKYAFDSIINKWDPSNGSEEVEQKKSKSKYKRWNE